MKLLISTLKPSNNYGQILQAYASQEFFRSKGYESFVFFHSKVTAKLILRKILEKIIFFGDIKDIKKNAKKSKNFQSFIDLKLNKLNARKIEKCIMDNKIDVLAIGSDQVWRKEYVSDYPDYYFPSEKVCETIISIAASTGKEIDINDSFYKKYLPKLENLDLITCREDLLSELITKKLNLKSFHICDPTLLLDVHHYEELSKSSNIYNDLSQKKYILLYGLDLNIDNETKNKLSGISNLEIIEVNHYEDNIENFLAKFRYASYVITDSFHGLQFSCIFNKQFIVRKNPKRGSLRFDSFLRKIKCENQFYIHSQELESIINSKKIINYKKELDEFISFSKNILNKSV